MGIKTTVICDVCAAERKEANHWFMALCETHNSKRALIIEPLQLQYLQESGKMWDVLCGEACVQKWVSLCLGRITKPRSRAQEIGLSGIPQL